MLKAIVTTLPMIVCAVMAAQVAIALKKKNHRGLPLLLIFLIDATLLYTCHFVYFNSAPGRYPVFAVIYRICNLTVWPLYLLYILRLTQRSNKWIATGVIVTALFVATGLLWDVAAKVLFAIEVIATVTAGQILIGRYNRRLDSLYADNEERHLTNLTVLLWLMLATSIVSLLCNAIGRTYFIANEVELAAPSLMFSILLFSIALAGLSINFSIDDIEKEEAGDVAVEATDADNDAIKHIAQAFDELMTDRQLFLRHNIKVDDVAKLLCTNRTYIYLALTRFHHSSFSDYVNSRRIDYATQLHEEQPELPVVDVAERSGFASVTSYYRNLSKFGSRKKSGSRH